MIDVRCPACGFSTRVSPQFAGKTAACQSCGQPIQIGLPPSDLSPAPPARGGGSAVWVIAACVLVTVLCVLPIGGLVVGLLSFRSQVLVPAMAQARGAAQQANSINNLRQIGIAFHNYHDVNGSFPPAYVTDENGKPLYSWRVLLLPYLEQSGVYDAFDKNASWDSPQNSVLSSTAVAPYTHPDDNSTMTSYIMPTGVGLIAEPGKKVRFADVTDGTSNTVLLVDAGYPVAPWAAPTDFDLSPGAYTIGPGGTIQPRDGQVTVLFADGTTQSFDVADFPLMELQSMFTRAGGEVVNRY